ncbi:MAG: hypothetical protein U5K76_01765 [Woeseiaceae bacterium]|nr:hypothetical protein [Woeseiaceae bacterium]
MLPSLATAEATEEMNLDSATVEADKAVWARADPNQSLSAMMKSWRSTSCRWTGIA